MADNKQYITQIQDNGSVMISEDVVATIVSLAVKEVEGVVGLSTKPGADIADMIGKKNWGKGLRIVIAEDNALTVDCDIIVSYALQSKSRVIEYVGIGYWNPRPLASPSIMISMKALLIISISFLQSP